MNFLSVINTSSIVFIAILGTFIVFRLQWLRKEIDDYRGRITELLHPDRVIEGTLAENSRSVLGTIRERYPTKDKDALYGKSDKQFHDYLKEIIKIDGAKDVPLVTRDFVGQHIHTTLGGSYKLFNKRHSQRLSILDYFLGSGSFLLISFVVSAAEIAGQELYPENPFLTP